MKLIKIINKTKIVNYFGAEIVVPLNANFIGTDHGGACWAFVDQPTKNVQDGQWQHESMFTHVANFDLDGTNWESTLIEI